MNFFNWLLNPVKNHYADFTGRASREAFWMYVVVYIVVAIAVGIIEAIIGLSMLSVLLGLGLLVPSLAIGARRLHDTGMSGWWQLLGFIPFLGLVIMIILMARKGEAGPNSYGAHPGATSSAVPVGTPNNAVDTETTPSET